MQPPSTLLLEPLSQPADNLFVGNHSASLSIGEALFDLLSHVDVVLNVLKRGILWKIFKNALDLLFGRCHRLRPFYATALLRTAKNIQRFIAQLQIDKPLR